MPTFKSSPSPMTRKIHCWFGAQNTLGWFTFSPPQQEDLHSALKYLPRKISFPWKTLSGSLQCCRSTCMYLCVTCIVHIVLSIHSSEEELASCELTQGQVVGQCRGFPLSCQSVPFCINSTEKKYKLETVSVYHYWYSGTSICMLQNKPTSTIVRYRKFVMLQTIHISEAVYKYRY